MKRRQMRRMHRRQMRMHRRQMWIALQISYALQLYRNTVEIFNISYAYNIASDSPSANVLDAPSANVDAPSANVDCAVGKCVGKCLKF